MMSALSVAPSKAWEYSKDGWEYLKDEPSSLLEKLSAPGGNRGRGATNTRLGPNWAAPGLAGPIKDLEVFLNPCAGAPEMGFWLLGA